MLSGFVLEVFKTLSEDTTCRCFANESGGVYLVNYAEDSDGFRLADDEHYKFGILLAISTLCIKEGNSPTHLLHYGVGNPVIFFGENEELDALSASAHHPIDGLRFNKDEAETEEELLELGYLRQEPRTTDNQHIDHKERASH